MRHANTGTGQGGDDERPKLVLPKTILVAEVVDDKGGRFVALPIKETKQQ